MEENFDALEVIARTRGKVTMERTPTGENLFLLWGALTAVFFILQWGSKSRYRIYIYLVAGLVIVGAVFAFTNIDFLGDKLKKEMTVAEKQKESDVNFSRIGSLVFDMQYIVSHPLFAKYLSSA